MSVFLFNAPQGALPFSARITSSTVTTVVDATNNAVMVSWFQINETGGTVQNLTVDIYDGTNAVYLGSDPGSSTGGISWNATACTAKAAYLFSQGVIVPKGSLLRVTSSDAAGKFHVHGVQVRSTV